MIGGSSLAEFKTKGVTDGVVMLVTLVTLVRLYIEARDGSTTALLKASNLMKVLSAKLTSVVSPPKSHDPK